MALVGTRFTRALALIAALAGPLSISGGIAEARGAPRLDARAWILVDAANGRRLSAHAADRELPIASATKLMTAYVAFEELPPGRTLAAPPYRAQPGESLLGLDAGERATVRDLLYALLLGSANDAAVALAEGASGAVRAFVREMNETADRLRLTRTHFDNPIGLDSPGQRSTAADLAALTRRLLRRPLFRRIVDTPETVVRTSQGPERVESRNSLLQRVPWINGVKTGFTLDAGNVLVGSGTRKGVTLISVVLGAPTEAARDQGTLDLLERGFSLYRRKPVVRKGEVVARAELSYQDERVKLVAARDLRVSVRDDSEISSDVTAPEEVEGPLERGRRLGEVAVTVDGREAGRVPLLAARGADAASLTDRVRSWPPAPAILILIGAGVILIGVVAAARGRAGVRDHRTRG